ncbi:hypothetical protein GCM10007094_16240 [Pseudovibrio japonicus]|uniref:Uncharacterized protein n=1 Tax=Pseudovibrio japonicus TaxID=366534 RepID=A0ABQ3E7J5_9HYPH|nr:hypothetical protein GCM10007094_16240 [Pseudovibrio japonicus]
MHAVCPNYYWYIITSIKINIFRMSGACLLMQLVAELKQRLRWSGEDGIIWDRNPNGFCRLTRVRFDGFNVRTYSEQSEVLPRLP